MIKSASLMPRQHSSTANLEWQPFPQHIIEDLFTTARRLVLSWDVELFKDIAVYVVLSSSCLIYPDREAGNKGKSAEGGFILTLFRVAGSRMYRRPSPKLSARIV
jgi:hypothetical protein